MLHPGSGIAGYCAVRATWRAVCSTYDVSAPMLSALPQLYQRSHLIEWHLLGCVKVIRGCSKGSASQRGSNTAPSHSSTIAARSWKHCSGCQHMSLRHHFTSRSSGFVSRHAPLCSRHGSCPRRPPASVRHNVVGQRLQACSLPESATRRVAPAHRGCVGVAATGRSFKAS